MPDQNRITPVDVCHAERVVNGLALSFGLSARDTWTPQEVAELATAAEYVCTPGAVAEFVRKGYFGPADPQNLTAVEVYCFLSGLESRRRWRISPSKHDAKKERRPPANRSQYYPWHQSTAARPGRLFD